MTTVGVVRVKLPELSTLGQTEDIESFNTWKFRLEQHLHAVKEWKPFLNQTWTCLDEDPHFGFTDIKIEKDVVTSKESQHLHLVQMLEFISGYANASVMRDEILNESCSLNNIWFRIKSFYQIQKREARALELANLQPKHQERPEALYRRMKREYVDLLQSLDDKVTYKSKSISVAESWTPLCEKLLIVNWLSLIHPKLPGLVKKRFSLQLLSVSLQDLRVPICDIIPNLLKDLESEELSVNFVPKLNFASNPKLTQNTKFCELCKAKNRPQYNTHNIADCFLLDKTKRNNLKSKQRNFRVAEVLLDDNDEIIHELSDQNDDSAVEDAPPL